jgi:tetratricopeptide (TPR) repeat protein
MGLSDTNRRAYNAARIYFQEASRIYPNRPEPYYYSAETYVGEGKFEAAIPFYEKALEVDDTYALAQMGLGKAYAAMDDCAAAIPYFQDALIYSPGNIDATQGLSNCSISP